MSVRARYKTGSFVALTVRGGVKNDRRGKTGVLQGRGAACEVG